MRTTTMNNDDGAFTFENFDVVVGPSMVTTPLPGRDNPPPHSTNMPAYLHPFPGTMLGGSPHPVASGVTRGGRRKKQGYIWFM
jgi:hypothetical protein